MSDRLGKIRSWVNNPLTHNISEKARGYFNELIAEIERLRAEIKIRQHAVDRWVPCPDHRDKINNRERICYVCENETLRASEKHYVDLSNQLRRDGHDKDMIIHGLRANQIPGRCGEPCEYFTDNSDNDDVDFCDFWYCGADRKGFCHEFKPQAVKEGE